MIEWSGCHFLKVFKRYQSYSPCDMLQSIKKGVKGDLENVFLNLVQCIQNKPLYFADRREQPLNILDLQDLPSHHGSESTANKWPYWKFLSEVMPRSGDTERPTNHVGSFAFVSVSSTENLERVAQLRFSFSESCHRSSAPVKPCVDWSDAIT
ncbi:hypothetical protein JEQ12_008155 [Ovis aries]|uniref:Uncharacterized protein n=1 Tax=Ovis aries TaxID=9940 RepID=A0A836CVV4_SHEEP|nr:hypothetical protein JEQ12_008155 [Ovis aries]